ncbi:DUF1080 domain-containing protein [Fontisphaera persica]|uniref:3-keto-disaccharide hydrolase n=1 Tax=Fontisphaera persica TaxID=2974023 RepID=UPI0024C04D63|nr:DUF1080 domain-containing protein [Fontisphaera persica]WCJ59465.1 DUF1080 domain-containing protein [Fontisphaera persica]
MISNASFRALALRGLSMLVGCFCALGWLAAGQTNPAGPASAAETNQPVLTPVADEEFFGWLLGLGADSNKVAQLRQAADTQRYWGWFRDRPLAVRQPEQLLNGRDLAAFYPWLEREGTFADREGVFTLTNGLLRISGQRTGYLATRRSYSNYRLVAEFKWGEATWGRRKERTRNSGLCIHGVGEDKVWMRSIEIQIAEGQTGDVVVLEGAKLTVDGQTKVRSYDTFKRPGSEQVVDKTGFRGKEDLEKPHGEWNTLEVIALGATLRVKVNDTPVLAGESAYPSAGRIYLQSNGAEIFFRRLDVYPVAGE